MNSGIKGILIFLAGAGLGTGVTYSVLKSNYNKLMNQEVQDTKEYYDRIFALKIQELENEIALLKSGQKAQPKAEAKKATTKAKEPATKDIPVNDRDRYEEVVKTNYNAISQEEPEEKVTSKKTTTKKKTTVKKELKEPEIITYEEYTADRKHKKTTLTYLDQEDMVIDENYEPIDCPEDLIGNDFKDTDFSEDGVCVYIRNDSIGEDFEVVIDIYHTYKQFLIEEG